MQPKAVGFALVVVTLMAGCDVAPNAAKVLDPSGLRIGTDNYISNTNERDVPWGMTDTHSLSSIPARRVMLTGAGALKQSPGWA